MDVEKIKMLSLSVFIVSSIILWAVYIFQRPPCIRAGEISKDMVGRDIVLSGAVTYIHSGKTTFIDVDGFPVVFFSNVSVEKGSLISVYGTVNEYKGELELIGKRIIKGYINCNG